MDAELSKLCDTLSKLCDIPDAAPGALFGLAEDAIANARNGVEETVAQLYSGVTTKFRKHFETKGLYPEDRLVDGFDHEQHFQQVALISRESAGYFIPDIAFSETQVKKIEFPVGTPKDFERLQEEAEGEGDESSEGEHDDEFLGDKTAKNRSRQETAISDSEADDDDDEEEDDDDEHLDDDDDLEASVDSEKDGEGESGEDFLDEESGDEDEEPEELRGKELRNVEDWDQVEAREPTKNKKHEEKQPMSSYEKSKKKMMEEIRKLEEKQLEEKPWQLKGDVEADKRPQNSLLEEVLEYDITQRPAPVITEAVSHRLEDVILKRIKDRAFDDVERKIKPVDAPPELKKKIVLDQEKSKLSLAEVYEQEYVKQKSKAVSQIESALPTSVVPEIELSKEEKDINSRLAKLFAQLDCLSNFHYVPPPRLAEVEVVANLPAINVEEVGQDALTSANLLTPGEVSGTLKRNIKAPSEKTKTDKKRERRKKKVHQAKKFKKLQLSTSVKTAQPTPGKGKIKTADPALKSSTAFFSQLESQAKKAVDVRKRQAEDDKKNRFKAKKLKM